MTSFTAQVLMMVISLLKFWRASDVECLASSSRIDLICSRYRVESCCRHVHHQLQDGVLQWCLGSTGKTHLWSIF
jgi:hypothetical protein